MAATLGVSCFYHDAAAALVVDGVVVAAIQEERLSRRKHDPALPRRAAAACLAQAGLSPQQLDAVVFYENPYRKIERVLSWLLRAYPGSARHFSRSLAAQLGSKLWVLDQLAEQLGVPRSRVSARDHHLSHAASAFFVSPFDEAAVLTVDGVGEDATTAIYRGRGRELQPLTTLAYPHSLGLLYAALTAYLGFEVNEGEQKTMGLAAFGKPRFREQFAKLLRLAPDGSFELCGDYFTYEAGDELGFSPALERLLGPRRRAGAAWRLPASGAGDRRDDDDQRYADIAASLQQVTEEALLGLARWARQQTGADALCLAGGVALNAVANARLLREAGFSRLFVQPAASDAGGALGAALLGALEAGDPRPAPFSHAALGRSIAVGEAVALARELGLESRSLAEPAAHVAQLLRSGGIVGLCSDRFEWGPRALGQRSLLALPSLASSRERLNQLIKRRAPFQPFAPVVLAEHAARYFTHAPNDMTPFMTSVCGVQPDFREALPAVTHVDGSARVQTLTPEAAPLLGGVLEALARGGAPPIALNTSLNGAGEPIVADAADAIGFLASHPVDALVIEDQLFRRPS